MHFRSKLRLSDPYFKYVLDFFSLLFLSLFAQKILFIVWNIKFLKREEFSGILKSLLFSFRFDFFLLAWLLAPVVLGIIFFTLITGLQQEVIKKPSFLNAILKLQFFIYAFFSTLSVLAFLFFSGLNLIDIEFIHFTGRRMTLQSLFIFQEAQGKVMAYVVEYWILYFITFILFILFFSKWFKQLFALKKAVKVSEAQSSNSFSWKVAVGVFFILMLEVVAARGGLQAKPLSFVDAKYFTSPLLDLMMTNSGFSFIKSIDQKKAVKYKFFENARNELDKLEVQFSELAGEKLSTGKETFNFTHFKNKKPNIVILVLESFSYEYMGFETGEVYTPFLNQLSKESIFFKNGMADGRRSIEGIAALMAGIPAWMEEPFISSEFSSNQFLGLGTLAKQFDYATSFFHGGKNGTMYFDSFSKAAGFENYFGLNEYPEKEKHFDGNWGIFDHHFLSDVIDKTNRLKAPFLNVIFTLSSHHPYKIPQEYLSRIPESDLPILRSITYADQALREYFDKAKRQHWFNNTIFILVADHTGKAKTPQFDHEIGSFRVPVLIYAPNYTESIFLKNPKKIISQKDLLGFIYSLLTVDGKSNLESPLLENPFLFSKNIFVPIQKPQIIFDGVKYLVYDDQCRLEWSHGEAREWHAINSFFQTVTDEKSLVNNNCSDQKRVLFENYLKANLQLFSEALFDNRLYAPRSSK